MKKIPSNACNNRHKEALDSHDKLWVDMMDMAYPLHLIDLLAKLYRKQLTKVKVVEKHYQKGLSP